MDEKNKAPLKDSALEQVSGGYEVENGTTRPSPWIYASEMQNYRNNNPCPSVFHLHMFQSVGLYKYVGSHGEHIDDFDVEKCKNCGAVVYILTSI